MASSLLGLLCCGIGLFFPIGAIIGLVMVLANRGHGNGTDGNVCGKCQYSVRGATTFACPECGADLREVGVVAADARQSKRRKIGLGLLIGCGVMTLLGLLATAVMFFVVARTVRPLMNPQPPPPATPAPPPPTQQAVPATPPPANTP